MAAATDIQQVLSTLYAALKAAPHSLDGLTSAEAASPVQASVKKSDALHDIVNQVIKGTLPQNAATIAQLVDALKGQIETRGIDDRKFLLEHILVLLSSLPEGSEFGSNLSNAFITLLWNDLPHPPAMSLGRQHQFRSADGSGNNPHDPSLGAAGQPYGRNVTGTHPMPSSSLPAPDLVFDALLRRDGFTPHPGGISSLLFSFANIIIHDIFATNHADWSINDHSSYLDLQSVYGANESEQATVRTFKDGLLHPDTIADSRLAFMPPATAAIAVLFSRNHNWIAKRLKLINEGGYYYTDESDTGAVQATDNLIFGRARLINTGLFVHIILRDYIPAILNQTGSSWFLDPLQEFTGVTGKVSRGVGNSCAVEFNVLYRWHAAASQADEKWMTDLFSSTFAGKSPEEVTATEFINALHKAQGELGATPSEWEIHGWKRKDDGSFDDAVLARTLQEATREVACAFKARGNPAWFRMIDILGMIQARDGWHTCTLNEFRQFLGLTKLKSFDEWNPDTEVSRAAEVLYNHIDNLELFPGLLAEQPKPVQAGSGLCPGFTISRAILSDAAALVRGDRFFTVDFSTANLSPWGYDLATLPQPGAYGGMMAKMLFANLPGQYHKSNSTFALFPFITPEKVVEVLTKSKKLSEYDTAFPQPSRSWKAVGSFDACKLVLEDQHTFFETYTAKIKMILAAKALTDADFAPADPKDEKRLATNFYPSGYEHQTRNFFFHATADQIRLKSIGFSASTTRLVNVVRDVGNMVPTLYIANKLAIPLKTPEQPLGLMTSAELYTMLATIHAYAFDQRTDARHAWSLRENAAKSAKLLSAIISARLISMGLINPLVGLVQTVANILGGPEGLFKPGPEATQLYGNMLSSGRSHKAIVADCLGLAVAECGMIAKQFAQIVEFFLRPEQKASKARITQLCTSEDKSDSSDDELLGFALEGLRLANCMPVIPRLATDPAIVASGTDVNFSKGDGVIVSLKQAGLDSSVFGEPLRVNQWRPRDLYLTLGHGGHNSLDPRLLWYSLPTMMKEIFSLQNLRTAPGSQGQLGRFSQDVAGTPVPVYLDSNGSECAWPTNMSVLYEVSP